MVALKKSATSPSPTASEPPPQVAPEKTVTFQQWIGFFAMVLGMFLALLDIQIVASSLEQIQAGLSATRDEITWVQTAYLVAEVAVIPLSGWLGRALSIRYLFVISCGGFTFMSLLCAFAWNLPSMVVFRAFQGFFGGAMIPSVFAVTYTLFPRHLQPTMTVFVAMVVTVAPTTGPVLGGYITEVASWQTLFLVNIVPGILVSIAIGLFLRVDEPNWALLKQIDFLGILYIITFLGSLEFVLEEGVREEWFESRKIVFFSLVAASSGVAMFYRELTIAHPVVDLWAFRNRNFAMGCLFSFVLGIGLYSIIYIMPIYLATVKGLNSQQIGQYIMVTGMFQFASVFVAPRVAKTFGPRPTLALGLFGFGLGTLLNGNLTHEAGYWEFFWPQAMRGFSLLFCFLPINYLTFGTLPPDEVKNASGLYNLMRNMGGAIGLAITNTLMVRMNKEYYAVMREQVTTGSIEAQALLGGLQERFSTISLPDSQQAALKQLYGLLMRESDVLTANALFHLLAFVFFFALLLLPWIRTGPAAPVAVKNKG